MILTMPTFKKLFDRRDWNKPQSAIFTLSHSKFGPRLNIKRFWNRNDRCVALHPGFDSIHRFNAFSLPQSLLYWMTAKKNILTMGWAESAEVINTSTLYTG